MSDNLNNPKEYDAVLGSSNAVPVNASVLGGIEGVKRRLLSQSVNYRISALSEALKYDREGGF